LALAAWSSGATRAADYQPPTGFNGHRWGEPLTAFHGLKLLAAHAALVSPGKVENLHLMCKPDRAGRGERQNNLDICYYDGQVEGAGSFAEAEYYFKYDRNPWAAEKIQLSTITYLFCAQWQGSVLPHDLKKRLTLCAVRVTFRNEPQKHAAANADEKSNLDRVLRQLTSQHGEPPHYEHSGRITIETDEQHLTTPEGPERDYVRYRWCGVPDLAPKLYPSCPATVTLVFDAAPDLGTVLYAAPPLYGYAYARHVLGQENDELYVLLSGRRLDHPNRFERSTCTGTRICNPASDKFSAAELRSFGP
jgi:hypothetical protein